MSVFISKQLTVPNLSKALSDYAVGESVFIPVNGVQTEFLVVNQGLPSTAYDASCDGTWLLMKDVYEKRKWDSTNNDYANSDVHAYLNGTFLGLFDTDVQNHIKQVKIPYTQGTGSGGSVKTGANGLSAKVFLLSYTEVGFSGGSANAEGSVLSYFNGATDAKRIAYMNGTAPHWWMRSPSNGGTTLAWRVVSNGTSASIQATNSHGIRPAFILPYDTLFDPDTNEVKA